MTSSPEPTLERLTSSVGALIGGVDIGAELPEDTVGFIRQALLDHGVVFFRGQDLNTETFWRFNSYFGTPHSEESKGRDDDTHHKVQAADLGPSRHATAVWHADTTSLEKPPLTTSIRAVKVPEFGGDTCWASAQAAYEALSEPMKQMLDGLTGVHSIQGTIDRMGQYAQYYQGDYESRHAREQVHPVVLTHPESGRKTLYVSECFTRRIVELSPAESTAILAMLASHMQRPDFTVRWKWQVGDVAFWDNRSVQHYAVPDYESERVMERIVLAGVRPGVTSDRKQAVNA